MARKKKQPKSEMLIEIMPDNIAEIVEKAREYKRIETKRLAYLKQEVDAKNQLLEMVEKAGFERLDKGIIRFEYEGIKIEVRPRDELITVKEKPTETE